jgi:hypothetical protein
MDGRDRDRIWNLKGGKVVVCAWQRDGLTERPCLGTADENIVQYGKNSARPGSRLGRGRRSCANLVAPWRYLRRERDRDDEFSTFCPVYAFKSCAAERDEDDTHIRFAGTKSYRPTCCRWSISILKHLSVGIVELAKVSWAPIRVGVISGLVFVATAGKRWKKGVRQKEQLWR